MADHSGVSMSVRVLGGIAIERAGAPAPLPSSLRAVALLGWLATHPGLRTRSEVASALWPDVPDTSARSSVRTALWSLRRALADQADDVLYTSGNRIGLRNVSVDLQQFEDLVAADRLEDAVALSTGDLLAGLDDEWAVIARESHRHRVFSLLADGSEKAAATGNFAIAIARARKAEEMNPLSETCARLLMRRYDEVGDPSVALGVYDRIVERLRRELKIAPSEETWQLAEQIRTRQRNFARPSAGRGIGSQTTVGVEDFSRLVSGIYAAALTPRHWQVAIREIHRTLGGTSGSLLTADEAVWSIQNSTIAFGAAKDYAEHYGRLDHVLAAVEKGPIGAVRTGAELVAPNRKSEFYAGWLHPNELEDGLFARLSSGPTPTCFLVTSPNRYESFDAPERVKVMSSLVVHFRQALRTQRKLADLGRADGDVVDALEVVRHGIAVVGPRRRVINLNTAAERILRAEDGLAVRAGCLDATSTPPQQELHRALQMALVGKGSSIRSGQSFTCERPSGLRPYAVHILPLYRAADDEITSDGRALVLIVDPEREPEPTAIELRRRYGLTSTEAEIAVRVAGGADLKQIAEELSLPLTDASAHLRHVLDKTDTDRQAELGARLLTPSL